MATTDSLTTDEIAEVLAEAHAEAHPAVKPVVELVAVLFAIKLGEISDDAADRIFRGIQDARC